MLNIINIKDSIGDRGEYKGRLCTEIILAGCNLRCKDCQNRKVWKSGIVMSIDDILNKINNQYIIIKGGEPGLQDLGYLITELRKRNHFIELRSNGTKPIPWRVDWLSVSPKEPFYNFNEYLYPDEVVYYINDKIDYKDIIIYGQKPTILIPTMDKYFNKAVKILNTISEFGNIRINYSHLPLLLKQGGF